MIQFGDTRLPARFWNKLQPEPMGGCWLWLGTALGPGYGGIWLSGRMQYTHRLIFLVENEIPLGFVIDHKCRVRSCANPDHLRAITNKENVLSGVGISAMNAKKTACVLGHRLPDRNGAKPRYCKECKKLSAKRHANKP